MKRMTLLMLAAVGSMAVAAPKGDVAKGKEIANNICAACHAADGNSGLPCILSCLRNMRLILLSKQKTSKRVNAPQARRLQWCQQWRICLTKILRMWQLILVSNSRKAGEANPKQNFELGAKIFRGGIASKKIPACMRIAARMAQGFRQMVSM